MIPSKSHSNAVCSYINDFDEQQNYYGNMYGGHIAVNSSYTSMVPQQHPLLQTQVIRRHSQPPPPHMLRTVCLGNVPTTASVTDVVDHVKIGPVQAIRPLPEKNIIFVTFIDASSAAQFYYESQQNRLTVHGTELKLGWGKPSSITTSTAAALQAGATRNVYLGLVNTTEQQLRNNLSRFGHIEHVKIIPEKHIAFVHFLCIANAVKCVSILQNEWQSVRVNYGKDRCDVYNHLQQQQQQQNQSPFQKLIMLPSTDPTAISLLPTNNSTISNEGLAIQQHQQPMMTFDVCTNMPIINSPHSQFSDQPESIHAAYQHNTCIANLTVYLGNIHPDTTTEDICNTVHCGILSQIRLIPDKHICFITFADPAHASHFHSSASSLVIKNRRLKVGWGKPTSLPLPVLHIIQNGGSRNVYVGNIDDSLTEEKLKHDFSEYGDIEMVNTLKEKNCAFVNFTSISAAARAIEGIRNKEEYKKFRINYGKDRCGNLTRPQHKQKTEEEEEAIEQLIEKNEDTESNQTNANNTLLSNVS